MLYSFCLQINTSTRSCECQLQQVMVSLVSPVPLSCSRSSFSPGILCILSVLCNASLQLRQAGSSVFLLHRSAAGLLCECVWGEKRQWERERKRENMFCLCVCVCVSQSCSPLLPWQRWAHGSGSFAAQHCQSRAAGSLFVSVVEKCIHTHTNTFLHVKQTDRLKDWLGLTRAQWCLLASLWQRLHCCVLL